MFQISLVWAALGLLLGAIGSLAGARFAYPHGGQRWASFGRSALPPVIVALVAVAGGWLTTLALGRLAATATALGLAALAALVFSLWSFAVVAPDAATTHDAPASQ